MGKLIVIVPATLAALPRVWTELHDRWLERERLAEYIGRSSLVLFKVRSRVHRGCLVCSLA
jgi:hypothetical protein